MLVFVNTFSIHGDASDFERAFQTSSAFMAEQAGFWRHRLVRSTRMPERYLNIAEWADEASFHAAVGHPRFEAHVRDLRALATSEPHLCVPVLECVIGDTAG